MNVDRRKHRTAFALVAVILGMLGLTAASVPLYAAFCRATGWAGTPRVATAAPAPSNIGETRRVTVFFNADVDPHLPWRFKPAQRSIEVELGQTELAFFEATNTSDHAIVGRAVFNVTPLKVGYHFNKVACFCFDEQVLQPGETVQMPVSFFVDPGMLSDYETREVTQITLSYTFFMDEDATEAINAARTAAVSSQG